jgi:glutamyl-tRNA synthetase
VLGAMSETPPRLRFAPSPTGFFHVGGARTALYNWLIAERTGGTLVLRIEDTDTERNRAEWVEGIQSSMRWVGATWGEGPYFQSARTQLYADACARLVAEGKAYFCGCTTDEVRARNVARLGKEGENAGYDRHCRDLGLAGGGKALRFGTPLHGETVVVDLIRGAPSFDNTNIEDFVIQRSNGGAMFILANVVDDIDMRISHVVRGEEHLSNTPKAILLWRALAPGVALPVFAHVPVLVNEKRQKLSKRRDKVAVEDYRDMGILPEAMRNYLVLLGWAPGNDREYLSVEEMVAEFRLEDVNASPAMFDIVKLTAFNAEYIRRLPVDEFTARCEPWLTGPLRPPTTELHGFDPARFVPEQFAVLAPFVQERAKLLGDAPQMVDFLFRDEPVRDDASWDKTMAPSKGAVEMLAGFADGVGGLTWDAASLKALVERIGEVNGMKLGKAQAPIRVAVMGRAVGLPLFEALEVLGRERTMACVASARARLTG